MISSFRKTPFLLACFVLVLIIHGHSQASSSAQDVVQDANSPLTVTIFTAKEIVTLDPERPSARAVAVKGDRIFALGSLTQVKTELGELPFSVNSVFQDKVIVPGFIAQHDHPLLAGITMNSEVIAIEDWILPGKTFDAAKDHTDYIQRLKLAESNMKEPDEMLLSWGYHQYFHGPLKQSELDDISSTRPIVIWHRSAHEFYLNSAAEKKFGITTEWYATLSDSAKAQSDFDNGHYWEQGWFAVGPLLMGEISSPARVESAMRFVQDYFHANGVTTGAEPGGLLSKPIQDAQNAVLSEPDSPFRFYFIADGKSITGAYKGDQVTAETEKLLEWGKGMTAFLPNQVKLFADGAIYSQAMQLKEPYSDGHSGEWMMDLDFFARSFRIYWDAGYQIHVHVNGDAGLEMVLDTLQENMERKPREDHRTVIVHFAVSQKNQVERIKRLGAIVSVNPYYPIALADNYRTNGLEPERADSMVRLGDVERAGIPYSLHSDMPMAPGQPLFLMWAAVNRVTNEGNLRAPEQRISRLGALRAVTIEAAYSLQLEKDMGSIQPGKLSNFTILSNNPVTVDPMEIKDIEVWGTVLEGRLQPVQDAPQN